jgi:hypothetical protein
MTIFTVVLCFYPSFANTQPKSLLWSQVLRDLLHASSDHRLTRERIRNADLIMPFLCLLQQRLFARHFLRRSRSSFFNALDRFQVAMLATQHRSFTISCCSPGRYHVFISKPLELRQYSCAIRDICAFIIMEENPSLRGGRSLPSLYLHNLKPGRDYCLCSGCTHTDFLSDAACS